MWRAQVSCVWLNCLIKILLQLLIVRVFVAVCYRSLAMTSGTCWVLPSMKTEEPVDQEKEKVATAAGLHLHQPSRLLLHLIGHPHYLPPPSLSRTLRGLPVKGRWVTGQRCEVRDGIYGPAEPEQVEIHIRHGCFAKQALILTQEKRLFKK